MAVSTGQQQFIVDYIKWSDVVLPLDVLVEQYPLPQIVKLADQSLSEVADSTILLVSVTKSSYVVGRSLAGNNRTLVGPWLSLPLSYQGKFTYVHDTPLKDPRFDGVPGLAKSLPDRVVAKQAVSVPMSLVSSNVTGDSDYNVIAVTAGDELACLGVEDAGARTLTSHISEDDTPGRLLACLNQGNEYVTLPFDCKSQFVAIAGGALGKGDEEENIAKIVTENRLPLTVLQTDGDIPKFCGDTFTGVVRLAHLADKQDTILSCLLRKENGKLKYEFLELPLRSKVGVLAAHGMLGDQTDYNIAVTECCDKLRVNLLENTGLRGITRVLSRDLVFMDKFKQIEEETQYSSFHVVDEDRLYETLNPRKQQWNSTLPQRPPPPPPKDSGSQDIDDTFDDEGYLSPIDLRPPPLPPRQASLTSTSPTAPRRITVKDHEHESEC
ncbi:GAREM1 [Branchiostoma lanceolatum]|uniref:GAREM1 protein n=1 Tax=Branchiostoma lanceolatum TaxID=7740 RepID=A0A8K0EJ34_BRALA|nr:GAREM1 [Branchiostoma lanceolatum]